MFRILRRSGCESNHRRLRAAAAAQDAQAQVEQANLAEVRELLRGALVELADLRALIARR